MNFFMEKPKINNKIKTFKTIVMQNNIVNNSLSKINH